MSQLFGSQPLARRDQVLIVYDNRLLGRKLCSVVSDSEVEEGNMVAGNMTSELRSDYWLSGSVLERSLEPTPEIVNTFTLGSPRDIDWVSHHWGNVQVPWLAELWAGDPDAGGILLASSDWVAPVVRSEPGDFSWYEFPWKIGPTQERVAELAADMRLGSFYHFAAVSYGVTHVRYRFEVSSGTNGNADYLQLSFPVAGRAWQPQINASTPVRLEPVSRSVVKTTSGGVKTGIGRPTGSSFSFPLENLTDQEGYELFEDWRQREGEFARVVLYAHPEADQRRFFYSGSTFVGTLETFEALAVIEEPGETGPIFASRAVTGITVQETE